MATILYKKFIKNKNSSKPKPSQSQPCEHQRTVSNISDGFVELDDYGGPRRGVINQGLMPDDAYRKHKANFQNDEGRAGSQNAVDCSICKEEEKAMSRYRLRLMLGLFFPFLVQSLDTTIIAGAASFIASDFSTSASKTS